jgi:hypothetical protein
MSEREEPGHYAQEKIAEVESVRKVPERVSLWLSIMRDSSLSEGAKKRLEDQLSFQLEVTSKYEEFAIPSEFSTVAERLDMLKEGLFNVCFQNAEKDDPNDLGAVYKVLAADIEELKKELYQ